MVALVEVARAALAAAEAAAAALAAVDSEDREDQDPVDRAGSITVPHIITARILAFGVTVVRTTVAVAAALAV